MPTNRTKLAELQEAMRTPRGYARYVKERDPKAVIQWLLEGLVTAGCYAAINDDTGDLWHEWLDEEAL